MIALRLRDLIALTRYIHWSKSGGRLRRLVGSSGIVWEERQPTKGFGCSKSVVE